MASNSVRISDMLLQRLQEAHAQGSEVRIRLANSSFHGVPVHLDSEFVELLCLYVDESDEESMCERAMWLIKLSEIVAFSYPIDSWSKERLEALLNSTDSKADSQQDRAV
ncbi:MAG: hypothetical protein HC824_16525 [Synechococcales cyanobacterium RM1_1_8]|nr:hypothetical protein [Synechococcales cyanobacterium RM1_1_8]